MSEPETPSDTADLRAEVARLTAENGALARKLVHEQEAVQDALQSVVEEIAKRDDARSAAALLRAELLATSRAPVGRALALLERLEWGDEDGDYDPPAGVCLVCNGTEPTHSTDCEVKVVIARLRDGVPLLGADERRLFEAWHDRVYGTVPEWNENLDMPDNQWARCRYLSYTAGLAEAEVRIARSGVDLEEALSAIEVLVAAGRAVLNTQGDPIRYIETRAALTEACRKAAEGAKGWAVGTIELQRQELQALRAELARAHGQQPRTPADPLGIEEVEQQVVALARARGCYGAAIFALGRAWAAEFRAKYGDHMPDPSPQAIWQRSSEKAEEQVKRLSHAVARLEHEARDREYANEQLRERLQRAREVLALLAPLLDRFAQHYRDGTEARIDFDTARELAEIAEKVKAHAIALEGV